MPANKKKGESERRCTERNGFRLPVRFFDPNSSATFEGVLVNESKTGAFIETNQTLPLLTKIRIEGPGLVCHAEVCRVFWLGPEERGERSGGMAVRILEGRDEIVDADYETVDGPVLSLAARS